MYAVINTLVCIKVVIVILIYWFFTRNSNYWKNRNVPYNKPQFFFGSIRSVVLQKESIHGFLKNLYRSTTAPYIGFFALDKPILLIRNPELIKKILVSDFDYFEDRSVMHNHRDKYNEGMLLLVKQPLWKTLRSKVTSAFSYGKIKNMVPLTLEASNDLINYIQNSCLDVETVNARSFSIKYTIDAILSCVFGLRVNSHINPKVSEVAKSVLDVRPLRTIQMASYYFAPLFVSLFRMHFVHFESCQYLANIFLNTTKERKKNKITCSDLMQLMIDYQNKEPEFFDDEILVGLSLQFLVAGFETSGATIAFILYELSQNISIQSRLRDDINSTLAKHKNITYDAIQEIEYLEMVIKESLRKYPPLPFLDRSCTKTYTIPNSDVVLKKGMAVYICLTALHHDETYFPNPMEYNPERFSAQNKPSIVPYTYMPFGEGYRNCIGLKFGMLALSIGLIRILTNFEVLPSKDTPKTLMFENNGFMLTPTNDQIFVKFKRLKNENRTT